MFYAQIEIGKRKFLIPAKKVKEVKHIKRLVCPYCQKEVVLVENKYFKHKRGSCPFAEKNAYTEIKEEILTYLINLGFRTWVEIKETHFERSIPDFFVEKDKRIIAVFIDSDELEWTNCGNLRIETREEMAIERMKEKGIGYWYDVRRKQIFMIRNSQYIPLKEVKNMYLYRGNVYFAKFMKLLEEVEDGLIVQIGENIKRIDKRYKIFCYEGKPCPIKTQG